VTPTGAGGTAPVDPVEARAVQRDVDRLSAFSDGVFAIAITLLVVTIGVPDLADKRLPEAIDHLRPELFTYALSFLVVGLYWKVHHRAFRTLQRVDERLININLLLLGFVALIPFPTAILGKYGSTSEAVVIYSSAMAAVGLVSAWLLFHVDHAALIAPEAPSVVRAKQVRSLIAPVVFLLSIPLAYIDPVVAELFWITIAIANVVATRVFGPDDQR
jgi:uncharacterized membrane protein